MNIIGNMTLKFQILEHGFGTSLIHSKVKTAKLTPLPNLRIDMDLSDF